MSEPITSIKTMIPKRLQHKPGNKGRRGGAQPGAGKPKTIISDEDMKIAEQYAFEGCLNNTICGLMDWDCEWLIGRKDILKRLTKMRQKRKLAILKHQNEIMAGRGRGECSAAATMAIFVGKNELGQTDSPQGTGPGILPLVIVVGGNAQQIVCKEVVKAIDSVDKPGLPDCTD
jgi:hypothetical protein